MTITKETLWCKLEVESTMAEQLMLFKYLGIIITLEVKDKGLMKEIWVSDPLLGITWKNKYLTFESKSKNLLTNDTTRYKAKR